MTGAAGQLRVLTLNAGLIRLAVAGRPVVEVPHLAARLACLGPALAGAGPDAADVLCLQEVFSVRHRDRLVAALRETHPHVARHDADSRRVLTHGLLVLSRHPLSRSSFTRFRDAPWGQRAFVRQGVLTATVEVPGLGPVHVLDTHTTAGGRHGPETPRVERLRGRQLEQLHQAAQALTGPVLVCGDLNAGPQASPGNFAALLAHGYVDPLAGSDDVTWDPANALNRGGPFAGSPPQRIDHVLLDPHAARRLVVTAARVVHRDPVVPAPTGPVTLSDHAGVLVALAGRGA